MSVNTFKRNVWAAHLLTELQKNLVSQAFVNHNYEGLVPGAKSVTINTLGDIAINDYDGSDIVFEELSTTDQTLLLDYQKDFAFEVKDVDKAQVANSGELMTQAMKKAAYKLGDDRDAKNFSTLVEGAGVTIGSVDEPIKVTTSAEAKALLLKLREAATKANVPKNGRRVAVSPEFQTALLSDTTLQMATPTADDVLKVGYLGTLFGLEIYETNNMPRDTVNDLDYAVLSHPDFMTEASQIDEMEAGRREANFSDYVKGLQVSGRKVTVPQGVIKAVVSFQ